MSRWFSAPRCTHAPEPRPCHQHGHARFLKRRGFLETDGRTRHGGDAAGVELWLHGCTGSACPPRTSPTWSTHAPHMHAPVHLRPYGGRPPRVVVVAGALEQPDDLRSARPRRVAAPPHLKCPAPLSAGLARCGNRCLEVLKTLRSATTAAAARAVVELTRHRAPTMPGPPKLAHLDYRPAILSKQVAVRAHLVLVRLVDWKREGECRLAEAGGRHARRKPGFGRTSPRWTRRFRVVPDFCQSADEV